MYNNLQILNSTSFSPATCWQGGLASLFATRVAPLQLSRELYKSNLFLQNKANFKNDRIYTSTCDKGSYGNLRAFFRRKNKAKQSQSKPNFGPKLALLFINFSNVVTCLLKII
jgi:hypothetical protein